MKHDTLTREIIRRMTTSVGLYPTRDGTRGLTVPELESPGLSVVYGSEGGRETLLHPVWAGKVEMEGVEVRALGVDLSVDDTNEYMLLIRVGQNPIYAMKLAYDSEDFGLFVTLEGTGWIPANMIVKARSLAGLELLNSFGLLWQPCSEFSDLDEAARVVLEF